MISPIEPGTGSEGEMDLRTRRDFYKTDTGKLLQRFENALATAWRYDAQPNASDMAVQRAFEAVDAARTALIAALAPAGAQ